MRRLGWFTVVAGLGVIAACGFDGRASLAGSGGDPSGADGGGESGVDDAADDGGMDALEDSPPIIVPPIVVGSCEEARKAGVTADVQLQLYLGADMSKPYVAQCVGMGAPDARTYLVLTSKASGANISTYDAARIGSSTVTTRWTGLRFDPALLVVDTSDFKFSTSTGSVNHANEPTGPVVTRVPYGVARDCSANNSTLGKANIDLTGLPFVMNLTATKWVVNGYQAAGQTQSTNPRVVDVKGGGFCGWNAIADNRFGGNVLHLAYQP